MVAGTHLSEDQLPELYRLLVDTLEDTAVFLIDTGGRIVTWNPGVERLLGFREPDFIGRPAAMLFTPEDQAAGVPEQELHTAATEGRAMDQRWHVRSDGTRLFADGSMVALKNAQGNLIGYAKVLRDITARKRSADEQKLLADAAVTLAGSLDYDTTLANVARLAAQELADYCIFNLLTQEQRLRRVAWAHRDPARQLVMNSVLTGAGLRPPLSDHPLAATLQTGGLLVPAVSPEWMEENMLSPEGRKIAEALGLHSIMVVPVRARDTILGTAAFCRDRPGGRPFDEHDLRLAEELGRRAGTAIENARLYRHALESEARLKESEGTLRLATEAAGVGIWSLEISTGKLTWSEQAKRIMGYDPDAPEPDFDGFLSLIYPEDRDAVKEAIRRALEEGADYDAEFRVVAPDGSLSRLAARGLAHRDREGRPVRFIGITMDVTERRRAEEAAQEAHRMESIGMLAAGIAHEFNNLLTGILGNASLVGEELPPGSRAADQIDDLVQSAERAAQLTRQLLAYSGKSRFVPRQMDLSTQILEIAPLLNASLPRRVQLQFDLPRGLPRIEADINQVQQVTLDLVLNAGEAIGEEPGTVTVRTAASELDESEIRERFPGTYIPPGGYVMLEVRDTGSGMEDSVKQRIFEPFFSTKFAGRGLGLAALQGIVRKHGGAVSVESAPGHGSTFRLYFPVAEAGEAFAGRAREPRRTGSILVADDEEIVRKVARSALEKRGYRVELAANGREAVEIFRKAPQHYAAVLLDMAMPVMTGEEAMAEIRNIRPGIPVVASSGYSETEALRRFGAGISRYLQKPYTAAKLADAIDAVVGASSEGRTAP